MSNKDYRVGLAKHAIKSESASRLSAMVRLARTELEIASGADRFDGDSWKLNVFNGTINLRTGQLQDHSRDDFITRLAPVSFDPREECPRWEDFIDEITARDQEQKRYLRRLSGYALTGSTREQAMFILYGTGANGKSTFVKGISDVMGEYANQTPTDTLFVKRTGSIPNDIARLKGARLVTAVESEVGRRLAESLIKQVTGGDKIAARFLNKEFFEFVPEFKLFLATNHKPVIKGTDHAIWRRIRLIPFLYKIPEKRQDKDLADKLLNELPGILNWMIKGCLEWQQQGGLGKPKGIEMATKKYRAEMDLVGQFLEGVTTKSLTEEAPAKELYELYRVWCDQQGEKPMTNNAFATAMTERGVERGKDKRRRTTYLGLEIKPEVREELQNSRR